MTNGVGRVVANHIDIVLHTMGARAHTLRARHRSAGSDWPLTRSFTCSALPHSPLLPSLSLLLLLSPLLPALYEHVYTHMFTS